MLIIKQINSKIQFPFFTVYYNKEINAMQVLHNQKKKIKKRTSPATDSVEVLTFYFVAALWSTSQK